MIADPKQNLLFIMPSAPCCDTFSNTWNSSSLWTPSSRKPSLNLLVECQCPSYALSWHGAKALHSLCQHCPDEEKTFRKPYASFPSIFW
jgi:hypothetical protein